MNGTHIDQKRAWWKSQPDFDQEKVSRQRRRRWPSTILTFLTGRRRPDWRFLGRRWPSWHFLGRRQPHWGFLLVDVHQTELFYRSTSTRLSFSTGRHPGRQSTLSMLSTSILLTFSSRPSIVAELYILKLRYFIKKLFYIWFLYSISTYLVHLQLKNNNCVWYNQNGPFANMEKF